jgi:hypothetical protein
MPADAHYADPAPLVAAAGRFDRVYQTEARAGELRGIVATLPGRAQWLAIRLNTPDVGFMLFSSERPRGCRTRQLTREEAERALAIWTRFRGPGELSYTPGWPARSQTIEGGA